VVEVGLGAALVVVMAWMTLARAPQPAATAAVIEDKTYTVTPAAMKVKAGFVTGEVTEMKVTSTSSCPSAAASERRPPRGDKHGRFHHDPGFPRSPPTRRPNG